MRSRDCGGVREVLPEWAMGALDPAVKAEVGEHLSSCEDCAGEAEVLRMLLASRPEPPAGLGGRIIAGVRKEMETTRAGGGSGGEADVIPFFRRGLRAPTWALSAAAVVIVSLGIGVVWNGESVPEVGQDPIQVVAEEPLPEAWLWDDGMVAGAPVFDDLTDEELEALIRELEG